MEKCLDCFLLAESLGLYIGHYRLWVVAYGISNHKTIFLQLDLEFSPSRYPFKFNKTWMDEKDLCELVQQKWNSYFTEPNLSPAYKLVKKLHMLRLDTSKWDIDTKINNTIQLSRIEA